MNNENNVGCFSSISSYTEESFEFRTQQQSYRGNATVNGSSSFLGGQQSAAPLPPNCHCNHLPYNAWNSLASLTTVQIVNVQNTSMTISNEGMARNVPAPSMNNNVDFNPFVNRPAASSALDLRLPGDGSRPTLANIGTNVHADSHGRQSSGNGSSGSQSQFQNNH